MFTLARCDVTIVFLIKKQLEFLIPIQFSLLYSFTYKELVHYTYMYIYGNKEHNVLVSMSS